MTDERDHINAHPSTSPPVSRPKEPVGIGLRHPYYEEILETDLNIGWIEVHPENYFGGGLPRHFLTEITKQYDLSLHAVGLSLGSDQPVSETHLQQFKELIDIYQPFNISDHASWSASGNAHLNDLLPLPYTQESLNKLARNIDCAQEFFGRQMLIENPSTYLAFSGNEMHEDEFMNRLAEITGCGILLDINNIYVQAVNHDFDAWDYINTIDARHIGEIHLAGHIEQAVENSTILIDTHSRPVKEAVWDLYEHTIQKLAPKSNQTMIPTLIEWDQDFPTLDILVGEANKARNMIQRVQNQNLGYENAAE